MAVTDWLVSMLFEKVTVSCLEDALFRLEEQSSNGSIYGRGNETADKGDGGIAEILQEMYDEITVQA